MPLKAGLDVTGSCRCYQIKSLACCHSGSLPWDISRQGGGPVRASPNTRLAKGSRLSYQITLVSVLQLAFLHTSTIGWYLKPSPNQERGEGQRAGPGFWRGVTRPLLPVCPTADSPSVWRRTWFLITLLLRIVLSVNFRWCWLHAILWDSIKRPSGLRPFCSASTSPADPLFFWTVVVVYPLGLPASCAPQSDLGSNHRTFWQVLTLLHLPHWQSTCSPFMQSDISPWRPDLRQGYRRDHCEFGACSQTPIFPSTISLHWFPINSITGNAISLFEYVNCQTFRTRHLIFKNMQCF